MTRRRCAAVLAILTAAVVWAAMALADEPAERELPVAPGAVIDRAEFGCSRPLPKAAAGWTLLPLDVHVLSCAATDLADLRLIDGRGRQIPYLLEAGEKPLAVDLPAPEPLAERRGGHRFRLTLPYRSLPGARLHLATSARVFERTLQLERPAESARGTAILAEARWSHADAGQPTPELELDLPRRAGRELTLVVEDADNAPLPITGARLTLPAFRLRFFYPHLEGGRLTLLYGRRDLDAPRYDLALMAADARQAPARTLSLPPAPAGDGESGGLAEGKGIWLLLGLAIAALLALLARLLKPAGPAL